MFHGETHGYALWFKMKVKRDQADRNSLSKAVPALLHLDAERSERRSADPLKEISDAV